MNPKQEFEKLHNLETFPENDTAFFLRDSAVFRSEDFGNSELTFIPRRERIDSEDFIVPGMISLRKATDIMQAEFQLSKPQNADDFASSRRRSSAIFPAEGKLFGLEVRLEEVHFEPG